MIYCRIQGILIIEGLEAEERYIEDYFIFSLDFMDASLFKLCEKIFDSQWSCYKTPAKTAQAQNQTHKTSSRFAL